jgi:hypothetical protein
MTEQYKTCPAEIETQHHELEQDRVEALEVARSI